MSDRSNKPVSLRSQVSSPGVRWALLAVVVTVALVVALWPRSARPAAVPESAPATQQVSAADRAAARLLPCPTGAGGPAAGPLRGITLTCLADGRPMSLAAALAGKPAVVSLWAYWCQPCAVELPALQQFARRAGAAVTVLTVHSDPNEAAALARLTGLDVHLPSAEDPGAAVRAAVGAPDALPVSVLLRPDGSVAKLVVRPFADADDIAATVARELGVVT